MKPYPQSGPGQAGGFSLVEVALALGIAAFCLAAVFALLPIGFTSNQQSSEETAAVNLLTMAAADLKAAELAADTGATATTKQFEIKIPSSPTTTTLYFNEAVLEGPTKTKDSRYRLDIAFLPSPSGSGNQSAALARLKVSWPAAAANPVNKVETLVALDRR
jgi:uncharacterized protein (TIGR02598 family)